VLDRWLNPMPLDASGELFVGGPGVARGYVGQPALTAERFVPDPFSHDPGARVYRTGDVACRRADERLTFFGRNDAQVKIRGYRLELTDIERTLERHRLVQHAAVMPRVIDGQDDVRLVAYLVPSPGEELIEEELRTFLTKQLPSYMIPSTFAGIAALPLTPNGKLDRQALPWPLESIARLDSAHPAATGRDGFDGTETERGIAAIWQELLKRPPVAADDNFFDLGGHSLLMLDLVSCVHERFGVEMSIRGFFDHPTIRALAAQVDELRTTGPQRAGEAALVPEAPQ
jgi:acyl carrier protein